MRMTSWDAFLTAADFEHGLFPPREFELRGDKLAIGDADTPDVSLEARYDRHTTLYLDHHNPSDPFKLLSGHTNAILSGSDFPEPVELLSVSMQADRTVFLPRFQPLLWRRADAATSVSAILVNGPSLEYANGQLSFAVDQYTIECREFQSARDFRREARLHKDDSIATAELVMTATDGNPINADAALTELTNLSRFFTFVRGGNSAVGNLRGLDANSAPTFAHLGFGKSDGFWSERNWCDEMVIRQTPQIYGLYRSMTSEPEARRVLVRALDYYRAANVGRAASAEMALVASYAALETLVPYILSSQAGWSNNLLGSQTAFADKLRAATAFIGLTADPLEHAPDLTKRAKADANGDPFDILALFRNRITHHKKAFSYSGVEIMEAWLLSQWLCELLVFFLLGYRGEMNDRRRYTGWRGPTVPVPLS